MGEGRIVKWFQRRIWKCKEFLGRQMDNKYKLISVFCLGDLKS